MEDLTTAVISVGGKGTRFSEISSDIPKPLFPIDGVSCLERSIIQLCNQNIKNIIMLTCYKKEFFNESCQKLSMKYGISILIRSENVPMGECGGLWDLLDILPEHFIFVNGDLLWSIDIARLFRFHKCAAADVTLCTHITNHPEDSDVIEDSWSNQIVNFSLKPHKSDSYLKMNLGNAGISIINRNIISILPKPLPTQSWCNAILTYSKGYSIKVFSYNTTEYIKDIGTPNRFRQAINDLKKGLVDRKCYINSQAALFLDRDNTLIYCPKKAYITSEVDILLIHENINKIRRFVANNNFDMCIMVTNQPQVAMGFCSVEEVIACNSALIMRCYKSGLVIDDVSFCPHHPHTGFEGEVKVLKTNCFCRKPSPGMLIEQAFNRNIDLQRSAVIGDSPADLGVALSVGARFYDVDSLQ